MDAKKKKDSCVCGAKKESKANMRRAVYAVDAVYAIDVVYAVDGIDAVYVVYAIDAVYVLYAV